MFPFNLSFTINFNSRYSSSVEINSPHLYIEQCETSIGLRIREILVKRMFSPAGIQPASRFVGETRTSSSMIYHWATAKATASKLLFFYFKRILFTQIIFFESFISDLLYIRNVNIAISKQLIDSFYWGNFITSNIILQTSHLN